MVERGSGIAVWRQIGESLADDIRNKLYLAGEQLPSGPSSPPSSPSTGTPFAARWVNWNRAG